MTPTYYDWDGIPISFEEWVGNWQDRTVARDVKGDTLVVTSYLGLPNMVFETLVQVGGEEVEIVRTGNVQDAVYAHMKMKRIWIGCGDEDEE